MGEIVLLDACLGKRIEERECPAWLGTSTGVWQWVGDDCHGYPTRVVERDGILIQITK